MSSNAAEILHVSDTALLTAACRTIETGRPDELVRDPFAAELAGERGMAIAGALPRLEILCFGVGIRSRFFDELVLDAVAARGAATVLSLGCGLDTRPWRLDLPAGTRWIEADFPSLLEYKHGIMARHQPRCRLERIAADLNEPQARSAVFSAAAGAPALMITEGLLMYLPAATIEAFAVEAAQAGVRYWLSDITSAEFSKRIRMDSCESLQQVRAAECAEGAQIFETLDRTGWTLARRKSYITDAMQEAMGRIRKLAGAAAAEGAASAPPPLDDPSGVHLFGRAS